MCLQKKSLSAAAVEGQAMAAMTIRTYNIEHGDGRSSLFTGSMKRACVVENEMEGPYWYKQRRLGRNNGDS